jgi:hypothetical protein
MTNQGARGVMTLLDIMAGISLPAHNHSSSSSSSIVPGSSSKSSGSGSSQSEDNSNFNIVPGLITFPAGSKVVGFLDSPFYIDIAPYSSQYKSFPYEEKQKLAYYNTSNIIPR